MRHHRNGSPRQTGSRKLQLLEGGDWIAYLDDVTQPLWRGRAAITLGDAPGDLVGDLMGVRKL